jgi:uncharacterized protein involved in outer membrane biogenesis
MMTHHVNGVAGWKFHTSASPKPEGQSSNQVQISKAKSRTWTFDIDSLFWHLDFGL